MVYMFITNIFVYVSIYASFYYVRKLCECIIRGGKFEFRHYTTRLDFVSC